MPKKYMNYARTQELIYGIRQALTPPVKEEGKDIYSKVRQLC